MGAYNMIDLTVAQLKKQQTPNLERVHIVDAGMVGVYTKDVSETRDADDYIVLRDYWDKKYVRTYGERLIVEAPTQATYTVKGEELLRITNNTIKTIIIPDNVLKSYVTRDLEIKDEIGAVASGDILITTESAKIDGQDSDSLSIPYGSLILRGDGVNLFTKGRFG